MSILDFNATAWGISEPDPEHENKMAELRARYDELKAEADAMKRAQEPRQVIPEAAGLLWGINNDGTITIPSALKMLDTPIFISAGIAHNDRIIASSIK